MERAKPDSPSGLQRPWIRTASALRRDGVHWLLLFDGQMRDEDFLRMADNGLLRLAGREGGARLYRF